MKDDLLQLQKYAKVISDAHQQEEFKKKAKEVEAKKLKANLPKEVYVIAYGPIHYSKKARAKWERYMNKKYWWLRSSYDPKKYPTTHMKDH